MTDHTGDAHGKDARGRGAADWWRQMSRSWTGSQSLAGSLASGVTRMADLFGFSPGALLQELVDSVTNRLVGREVEIRFGDATVKLTVTRAHVTPAPAGLVVGQLGSVELDARDVQWAEHHVDELTLEARNVHIGAGSPHAIVAAPVRFTARLTERTIDAVVAAAQPRATVVLTSEGGAHVMWRGREVWGHVEVEPRVDGSTLILQLKGISLRHWRPLRRGLKRVPVFRYQLPLPPDVVLDDVTIAGRRVVLRGALREWREPVTAAQLEEIIRRVRSMTGHLLEIPRHAT